MPYLKPKRVLREFSRYTLEEVRPALKEDEEFMRGQVGSMASTLRFLAGELEGVDDAVATQRSSLLDALADARDAVNDPEVEGTLTDARARVADADGTPREIEQTVLAAADDALAAVDALDGEGARAARAPLYEFLDDRLDAQLGLLGRPTDDG
jgi:hypothetical protein